MARSSTTRMAPSEAERLMTVPEFGERIRVCRTAAYQIVAAGKVDVTYVNEGKRPAPRISEAALLRYIERHTVKGRRSA